MILSAGRVFVVAISAAREGVDEGQAVEANGHARGSKFQPSVMGYGPQLNDADRIGRYQASELCSSRIRLVQWLLEGKQ